MTFFVEGLMIGLGVGTAIIIIQSAVYCTTCWCQPSILKKYP